MARTGVAPMPALISSTGAWVASRMNVPRGALLATVPREIALPVAVDVELAHSARAAHRVLVDAREDRLALPRHVLGHADDTPAPRAKDRWPPR